MCDLSEMFVALIGFIGWFLYISKLIKHSKYKKTATGLVKNTYTDVD